MLKNKKLEYLTPEVDVFTVQTEGVICQSTGNNSIPNWGNGNDLPFTF